MGNNRKRSPSNKEKEKGKGKGKGKGSLQTNERDVRIQIDDQTSQGQSPALRSNESTSTQSSETSGSTFFENISGSAFTGGTYQQTNGHSNSVTIELNVNHYPPTQDSNTSQSATISQPSPPLQPSSSQKASTDLSSSPVEAAQYTSSSNDLPHHKNNYDVYTEQLQRQRRGNPLYNPEPNRRLPMIYQRMGVSIGDVGTFTQFGGFSFLFNICLPRDHPSQPDDLLEDFEPINLRARDVYSSTDFKPGSHLASQNIHKVSNDCRSADLIFETDVSEGAILTLPEGFVAHDLENLPQIQAYAAANIESWYRYINGTCGRLAKNGEIRLVIGCDKTTSWGMAVINNQERPTHHQLRFRPVESMTPSSTSSSSPIPLHTWDYSGYVNAKVGPFPEEIEVLREEDNSTAATTGRYSNQCLFVRTLNLTLRDGVFASINDELALVLKEKWSSFSSTSHNSTNSSSSSINEPCSGRANQAAHGTNFGTQRGFSANIGDEHVTITMSPTAEKSHPSDALNRTILEKAPGCRLAITRDEHWCSVLNEDDECMPSTVQLAERVFKSYDIVEENGVAFLEHKKQNALSTSASYTVLSSYVHRFDGVTRPTLQIAAPQNAPDLSLYRARTKKEVHLHDENGTAISKIEDDEYKLALEHDVLSTSKEHDLPHKGYMALENITTKFYGPSRAIEQLHEEYPQEQQSFPWNSMFTENQMMVQQPPIISPFSDYEDYPHIYSSPPPLEPDMDTMKPQGHSDPPAIVMDVNDLISSCLSLVPVPGLIFAFTTLRWVITTAEQIQDSKEQIRNLTESLAQLMLTLNDQYKKGKLLEQDTRNALVGLATLLGDVSKFIEGQKKNSIFAQIITNKKRLDTIDSFHRRIAMSVNAFHVASLIDAQHLMKLNEYARQNDQRQMYKMLRDLQSNQRALMEALDISKNEPIVMMAALERRIEERPEASDQQGDLYNFYTTSLFHLRTTSGKKADLAPWTITSFDVEFGRQIGSGGFGTVFRAKWNEMDVAVKVMRNSAETIPRAATVRREVDTWSRLRHPHILQFLGANILDDKPFIVTPLIRGGNVAEYVVQNPDCNRLIIIHQISLGLAYLHGQRVVHGDIKCTNVLIDDGGNALLCDFGLARIKADVNSRSLYTSLDVGTQLGSRNWMAPELFEGSSLKMPCDVYALGMTIYEIYTGEVPLSQIHPVHLQEAVLHGTRPQRPDDYEAPQLTDAVWMIAEHCWARSPTERPTADTLCRDIKLLLEPPPLSSPPPEFPSSHLNGSTSMQHSGSSFLNRFSNVTITGGTFEQINGHRNNFTIINNYPPTQESSTVESSIQFTDTVLAVLKEISEMFIPYGGTSG